MGNRIDNEDKRIKKYNNGQGAILCSDCGRIVKQGFVREDVMTTPERITQADWKSLDPLYCKGCLTKHK